MKRIFIILTLISCSKKTTTPEIPQNPYDAFNFWNFKPFTKFTYEYRDSTIYKYSFYITILNPPNADTLVRNFLDTSNLSIKLKDSIWSIVNPAKVTYDTIKLNQNSVIFRHLAYDIKKEKHTYKNYPYPLIQSFKPIQQTSILLNDTLKIGNFMWSCSLIVFIDTLYIDSSRATSNKINDTFYIKEEVFSRIKYRYKFDRIVLNEGLKCDASDTLIKENYGYKYTFDSTKLVAYKGIKFRAYFDTTYAYIKHHTNADASFQISKNIKWFFIKNE
ncbi:MAG: hypothetical protein N2504_02460 [candidate division WOR-3 bacterium]|nr:hypothetical protein [candidate division WOR-3 bacterium]